MAVVIKAHPVLRVAAALAAPALGAAALFLPTALAAAAALDY
jgi:hypothetical protein